MNVTDIFLKYVKTDSQSDESSDRTPSSECQFDMARLVVEDLKKAGAENVECDSKCYVYASIPATKDMENVKAVGFIAHMDTAPSFSGHNVEPTIIENYDGGDIVLKNGLKMSPDTFSHLRDYVGNKLIVTDGNTLLGADDKAGIAEIICAVERIINSGMSHPKICIGFTPDEEIGRGADSFDVEKFGADYAYTIDGGKIGELEYENFNAAAANVVINGNCIHPGEAKNKMINSTLLAMEYNSFLPAWETPAHTEMYEGFYHLCKIEGTEEITHMQYIIRDHDKDKFYARKRNMEQIAKYMNDKYGQDTVIVRINDSYYNMKEMILPHMEIVEKAKAAFEKNDVAPIVQPIRGGTDGARLSYMGLPCPNLSAGGHNFHGKYEYIPVESMEKMVDVLVSLMTDP